MTSKRGFILTLALSLFSLATNRLDAAESANLRKVRMAFTSLSSVMCPPWIAREAGIFNKHGLDVEVIATPTGVEGMNALIAGEVQFLQISGGTTASAALGGADVMVVGTTLDALVQNLVSRPEIEKAEQLRGKSVGITRFGTSIDVGARLALKHFGLMPEKDVAIVQVGGMESMVTALQTNRIQAGILSYPAITQALKLGHRVLLDVASLGIPYAFTGITTRGRLIKEDPDLVRRYMMAQTEAIARAKRDKNFALKVMGKYLRTANPNALAESYDIDVQKYMLRVPLTTAEAMKSVLDDLAARIPKAKDADPKRFYDDTFVRQMQSSGFVDALYR
ncbi:MAG TPA: ABC transporter substrate-binding protein [Candidatus Limnocylindrales bacterium]|nr:ABC transporter substrate-binding protein [Candidatus Limnocylindrales bacterium]